MNEIEKKPTMGISAPDYEREYHRLQKENAEYRAENYILRETIIGMCKSFYAKGGEEE